MIAALVTSLATLLLVVLFGFGAMAVLAGAVMAVIGGPDDGLTAIPAPAAGLALVALGLLLFIGAFLTLAELVSRA